MEKEIKKENKIKFFLLFGMEKLRKKIEEKNKNKKIKKIFSLNSIHNITIVSWERNTI